MLGSQLAGDSFHKCAMSKTILGTLNSQKFPAMYPTLHCQIPCVKFQPLQSTEPRYSKTGCSTTPHNSPESCDPNCRPYTTERLLFTQNTGCRFAVPIRRTVRSSLKATKDNPRRGPIHDSLFSTQRTRHNQCSSSCSNCVTQCRVDALTLVTNRQCAAATRKTAMKPI